MRNRGYVGNAGDFEANRIQCAHCRFTPWAGSFDTHFKVLNTAFLRCFTCSLSRNLRSKRRALTRTAKTGTTRCCPSQSITLTIGNRHDGVIKRCVNMSNSFSHILFNFFAHSRLS